MANLFFVVRALSMLTAGWQQGVSIPGQHSSKEDFVMMILYGLDLCTTMLPLLTPRWQQGMDSLKRLLKKSGVST